MEVPAGASRACFGQQDPRGGGACDSTALGVGSGPADLDFALRSRGGILNL